MDCRGRSIQKADSGGSRIPRPNESHIAGPDPVGGRVGSIAIPSRWSVELYLIKRVWKVKPRQAREAATIATRIGDLYHEAGQRSEVRVYFNGTTLPGKRNRLFMEWTAATIDSPYGNDDPPIPEARELGARLRDLTEDTWIEFYELMTPAKAIDPAPSAG